MKIERDGQTYELLGAELKQAADEYERECVYLDIRDEFEIKDGIDDFLKAEHLDKYELLEEMLDLYYYRKEYWFTPPTVADVVDSALEDYGYIEFLERWYDTEDTSDV